MSGQSITAGTVAGVVRDTAGAVVRGTLVTLTDVSGGGRRVVEVSPSGDFQFDFLAPGPYEVRAEQVGYHALIVRGVSVAPGQAARIALRLTPDTSASFADTTWVRSGALGAASAHGSISGFALRRIPLASRTLGQAAALSTVIDWRDGSGTPSWVTAVDGISHRGTRHPGRPAADPTGRAFPSSAFEQVDVHPAPSDIEWARPAVITGTPVRGTDRPSLRLLGDWSGSPLASSRFFRPGDVTHSSWRGGLALSGPLIRDTARFLVGFDAEQIQRAQPRVWVRADLDSALLATARNVYGVELAPFIGPRRVAERAATGYGRLDWQVTRRMRVSTWTSVSGFRTDESGPLAGFGPGGRVTGTDVVASALVTSQFGRRVGNELRVHFDRSEHRYRSSALPATALGPGIGFGGDPTLPGDFERTDLGLRNTVHVAAGAHQLKVGADVSGGVHRQAHVFGREGVFVFSDPGDLALARGAYLRSSGPSPLARFSIPRVGGFLQDRWTLAPGFSLVLGLRLDAEFLSGVDVAGHAGWEQRTGLVTSVPSSISHWTGRLALDWLVPDGSWAVHAGIGSYYEETDPGLLAELITHSGTVSVQRGLGVLGRWLSPPSVADGGTRLSLLGPEFEPARSTRANLNVGRGIGRNGRFSLALDYQHTDFLLRRADLNRPVGASGADQHGRQIYGTLSKEGGVLGPAPGSNRRFDGFDLVSALNSDGFSDYWGVTVRLDQPAGRFLRLVSSYTYSRTTDNGPVTSWRDPYSQLSPFPSLADGDWIEGRSDQDVPHRVAIGAEVSPLGRPGVTLAAAFRFQSGRPFTPGFPRGVDINGDGSDGNDPAWVDASSPGAQDLFALWDCLAVQAGRYASRNSCREHSASALDLRVAIGPARLMGFPAELWIEVLNLVEPDLGVRDHALYTVVPGAALVTVPGTGVTTIPLALNGSFGQPMVRTTPGRVVRLGFRMGLL